MGYYTAISILTWLTLAIMCILVHENARLHKEEKSRLYVVYALIAASALAEWLAMILDGAENLPKWPLMLAKCADYALTPLAGGAIVKQMGIKNRITKVLNAVLAANVMFQIVGLLGGWTVQVDEHSHYHHGGLYIIYVAVYLAVIVLVLLQFRIYGTYFRKQNRSSLFAIMLLVVIGVGLQELISGVRTVYLALTLAAALLFIHNEEFSQIRRDESLEEKNEQIMTDELTGLLSRRAYSETLKNYGSAGELPWDLVAFEIDINELKSVNDTYGHAAGDELICGAAHCIGHVFSGTELCFRTGGDEFVVVAHMDRGEADSALVSLERESRVWEGAAASGLHLAAGYALAADYPGSSLEKLVARADAVMYEDKKAYYNQPEHDRRRRDALWRDAIAERLP